MSIIWDLLFFQLFRTSHRTRNLSLNGRPLVTRPEGSVPYLRMYLCFHSESNVSIKGLQVEQVPCINAKSRWEANEEMTDRHPRLRVAQDMFAF